VENNAESENLLNRIRDVILARIDGSLTLEETRDEYKNLLLEYVKIEKKYISDDVSGYIKGLLYNHNIINSAALTAVFLIQNDNAVLLNFCGDNVLMKALPELIMQEHTALTDDSTLRKRLTKQNEQNEPEFFMMLKKIDMYRESLLLAAVTSAPDFNAEEFKFLSELLAVLFSRNNTIYSPVMLNYISDISSEISRIINSAKGTRFYIDYFFLLNPYEAFSHIGIYPMIDFSDFVAEKLKMTYPENVRIFALSIFKYLVLYDEKIKKSLDIKRNRRDFIFQGNSIPYKVLHKEIDTIQSLYPFLEEL